MNKTTGPRFEHTYLYANTTIVLAWIEVNSKRWKTFVANRVEEIHQHTSAGDSLHTRIPPTLYLVVALRCSYDNLLSEATYTQSATVYESTLESKEIEATAMIIQYDYNIFNKFSCLQRLYRVAALCLRFIHNTRHKEQRKCGVILIEELRRAELCIVPDYTSSSEANFFSKNEEFLWWKWSK